MMNQALNEQASATLARLHVLHPDLKKELANAYAYAVFPSVGRASAVLGISYGKGMLFEQGRPIGTATITELTIGVQLGGQTFSELLIFPSKTALEEFKRGEVTFAANASAVIVKAAASGTADFHSVKARAFSRGGMLLELSLGGQKFTFVPSGEESRQATAAENATPRAEGDHPAQAADPAADEQRATDDPPQDYDEPQHATQDEEEPRHAPDAKSVLARASKGAETVAERAKDVGERAEDVGERAGDVAERAANDAGERAEREAVKAATPSPLRWMLLAKKVRSLVRHMKLDRVVPEPIQKHLTTFGRRIRKELAPLHEEQTVSKVLHPEVEASLAEMFGRDPGLRKRLEDAAGFAIFPSVGKASAVLGATYGRGEVFEKGHLIGYAAIIQLTIGVQIGGDTFSELIIFDSKDELKRFKEGKVTFAANAAVVLVKAGGIAGRQSAGETRVRPEGGLLLDADIGGQKIVYRGAALTRGKAVQLEATPA